MQPFVTWRHDIEHNYTQHDDIQHKVLICDSQHNDTLYRVPFMLSVVIYLFYAECNHAECHYAECRGACMISMIKLDTFLSFWLCATSGFILKLFSGAHLSIKVIEPLLRDLLLVGELLQGRGQRVELTLQTVAFCCLQTYLEKEIIF